MATHVTEREGGDMRKTNLSTVAAATLVLATAAILLTSCVTEEFVFDEYVPAVRVLVHRRHGSWAGNP
jgi:hypothetical protein